MGIHCGVTRYPFRAEGPPVRLTPARSASNNRRISSSVTPRACSRSTATATMACSARSLSVSFFARAFPETNAPAPWRSSMTSSCSSSRSCVLVGFVRCRHASAQLVPTVLEFVRAGPAAWWRALIFSMSSWPVFSSDVAAQSAPRRSLISPEDVAIVGLYSVA